MILTVLLLVIHPAAHALELLQFQRTVLERFPLILEQQAKVDAAEAKLRQNQGSFDHKIKAKTLNQFENKYDNQFWDVRLERQTSAWGSRLYAGQRQGTGNIPVYDQKYETSSIGEIFAGLEVPLLRNRAMDEFRSGREQARLAMVIEQEDLRQKKLELAVKAGQAYWKWVVLGQKLRIQKQWFETARERQGFLARKVKMGDTSSIKLTDNERTLLKRQSELTKTEREFELARLEIGFYLGTTGPALTEVPESFPASAPIPEKNPPAMPSGLPAFRIVEAETQIIGVDRELARSLRLPELNLGLEGARDLGNIPSHQGDPDQLRVALRIEIPIENNKGIGKVEEAKAKLQAIQQRRTWLHRQWEVSAAQVLESLRQLRLQIQQQEAETVATAKMAAAERKRWDLGDSDLFFVNIREQDEAEARVRLAEAHALEQILLLDYLSLDGELLKIHSI